MIYEDRYGNLWHPDEVDELSNYEVEEKGIHVFDEGVKLFF